MADPTPEAVEALANFLDQLALSEPDDEGRVTLLDLDQQAERVLADPGPLLEALAQAGVLEAVHSVARHDPQPHMGEPNVQHAGESPDRDVMQMVLDLPHSEAKWIERRYVSRWEAADA